MILNGIFNFWTLLDHNVLKHFSLPPLYTLSVTFLDQMKVPVFVAQGCIHHTDLCSRAEKTLNSWNRMCCLGLAKLGVGCALGDVLHSQDRAVERGSSVPAPEGAELGSVSPTWSLEFNLLF